MKIQILITSKSLSTRVILILLDNLDCTLGLNIMHETNIKNPHNLTAFYLQYRYMHYLAHKLKYCGFAAYHSQSPKHEVTKSQLCPN